MNWGPLIMWPSWHDIGDQALAWIGMFLLMLALDWIWAKYNQATTSNSPWRASSYAVLIYWLGAFGVLGYTHNLLLLIPASAGAFVGTFIATVRA